MKIFKLILSLFLFVNILYGQDSIIKYSNFSIRYSFYYNYKIIHHIPVFSFEYKDHNIYIGSQYSSILLPFGDEGDSYEKNTKGLNLGYRYYFRNQKKLLRPFLQYNFSIYYVKYNEIKLGPPYRIEHKALAIENTASIGIAYKILPKLNIFSGAGFGSYDGFFLMLYAFIPSSYIGIEYNF
ncbi:MAG: hypothetical protein WCH34_01245 [Bacteroidota bacterium]